MEEMRLYGVLSHALDEVWAEVSPLLEKAVIYSDGKYAIDDVYKALKERDMQLWLAYNDSGLRACCVTQLLNYPRKKIMLILFAAGTHFNEWSHFYCEMMQFAKENGCSTIECYGRDGWFKKLPALGFEKIHSVYRFNLI